MPSKKRKQSKKVKSGIIKPVFNKRTIFNTTLADLETNKIVTDWILYSMRFVLSYPEPRNLVLSSSDWFGFFQTRGYDILTTETYGNGISDGELHSNLTDFLNAGPNKIFLFTLSNDPTATADPDKAETHFQSFVIINHIHTIFAFDPSGVGGTPGIYHPGAIQQMDSIINTSKLPYKLVYPNINVPCQRFKSDVFCQTWSLYLQYEFMRQVSQHLLSLRSLEDFAIERIKIVIPETQIEKYRLLNSFIQSVIQLPGIQTALEDQFNKDVMDHPDHIAYSYEINPIDVITQLEGESFIEGKELKQEAKLMKKLQKTLADLASIGIDLDVTSVRASRSRR